MEGDLCYPLDAALTQVQNKHHQIQKYSKLQVQQTLLPIDFVFDSFDLRYPPLYPAVLKRRPLLAAEALQSFVCLVFASAVPLDP